MNTWIRTTVFVCAATPTFAVAQVSPYALGPVVGTNGAGLQVTIAVNARTNLRAGLNAFSYKTSVAKTDLRYSGKVLFDNIGAYTDYYPWQGDFRLTAGFIYNGNQISATARPTGGILSLGEATFPASGGESIELASDWRSISPYIGIGLGNPLARPTGLSFTADAGIQFTGVPRTGLRASTPLRALPGFDEALALEEDRIRRRLDPEFLPVVTVGLNYTF